MIICLKLWKASRLKKLEKDYYFSFFFIFFSKKCPILLSSFLCFEIPERLKPYVSDYKINVFNIAFLSDSQIDMFQSDFKFVAQYFQSKRQNKKYEGSDEEIHHVDELLKLFAALTGDNRFESMYNKIKVKSAKGGIGMGGIFSDIYDEGMSKGQADVIRKMLDAKALTVEQIADILKLSVAEVQKIADTVPAQA